MARLGDSLDIIEHYGEVFKNEPTIPIKKENKMKTIHEYKRQ